MPAPPVPRLPASGEPASIQRSPPPPTARRFLAAASSATCRRLRRLRRLAREASAQAHLILSQKWGERTRQARDTASACRAASASRPTRKSRRGHATWVRSATRSTSGTLRGAAPRSLSRSISLHELPPPPQPGQRSGRVEVAARGRTAGRALAQRAGAHVVQGRAMRRWRTHTLVFNRRRPVLGRRADAPGLAQWTRRSSPHVALAGRPRRRSLCCSAALACGAAALLLGRLATRVASCEDECRQGLWGSSRGGGGGGGLHGGLRASVAGGVLGRS